MKKLTSEVRRAMRKSGMTTEQIEKINQVLEPKQYKLKRDMVKRIEEVISVEGTCVVTAKSVFTLAGYKARTQSGHRLAIQRHPPKELDAVHG